jgi:hypothetical protein
MHIEIRGKPMALRLDNGAALISEALERWPPRHGIAQLSVPNP